MVPNTRLQMSLQTELLSTQQTTPKRRRTVQKFLNRISGEHGQPDIPDRPFGVTDGYMPTTDPHLNQNQRDGHLFLSCCLLNANGLVNKIQEFHLHIYSFVHEMFFCNGNLVVR